LWIFTAYLRQTAYCEYGMPAQERPRSKKYRQKAIFRCNFSHFYTFFTPAHAIFSSSFYRPPYTRLIKNYTSGGVL
jgi:hypothetical protein